MKNQGTLGFFRTFGVVLTMWMSACTTQKPFVADNLLNGEVLVIGHGAGGFDTYRNTIPPNTLEAVEQGLAVDLA
ncbi:MAG: hypothetical protein AAF570_24580, partial [Bacteroidota bacterium]